MGLPTLLQGWAGILIGLLVCYIAILLVVLLASYYYFIYIYTSWALKGVYTVVQHILFCVRGGGKGSLSSPGYNQLYSYNICMVYVISLFCFSRTHNKLKALEIAIYTNNVASYTYN